ncbi:hypothetical protein [Oryza sativa Japonica Group]|uniref:Os01g0333700 protein n=2 Tax=Oryza sativa subsp. japonica TaxID=39947 RepID=Q5ZA24_ORYSJ|nr:hypothetical protein OsJ_01593 [Oryza sativa Japonica Group]BAD53507.1 hypothetical protein [Oryza sativa Japonica Group]BAD54016.1 hypothetical protein [Oryza sativa Japonica Group]BAS71931.1 Os01g0333700 [Oryza sativa Japonica Group]
MVLRFRAVQRFNDKMGQNSVLQPRRFHNPPIVLPKKMVHRASLHKSANVPTQVKAAVLAALKRSNGRLSNGVAAIQRSTLRDTVIWSCQGDHIVTANVILVWHIGTSLFEMKYLRIKSSPRTADMITATHLSQYCAYLVAAVPELLPNDATWTKAHCKEVARDIKKALDGEGNDFNHFVDALGASCRHKVLQQGSKLAKQLVGEVGRLEDGEGETKGVGEAALWKLLAEFWSEMVLYLAPSDNVRGHAEALARGGEFITLLWALLLHAGITSRPGSVAEP